MGIRLLPVLLCAIASGPVGTAQTFRSAVRTVAVFATVRDGAGRLVGGLGRDDFRVFDDGRPVAIDPFDAAPHPMEVVVLLDVSSSMTGSLPRLREAAGALISSLAPLDRARIAAFSDVTRFSPDFSADEHELLSQLPKTTEANMTRLYDALVEVLDRFDGESNRSGGRRVIVVFSDGADTASSFDRDAVIARARETDAMIYAIGLSSRYVEGTRTVVRGPDAELARIAHETGGGYVEARDGTDLRRGFERVMAELHEQYLLGFPAQADGRVHAIAVQVKRAGCTVHAQRSYRASP